MNSYILIETGNWTSLVKQYEKSISLNTLEKKQLVCVCTENQCFILRLRKLIHVPANTRNTLLHDIGGSLHRKDLFHSINSLINKQLELVFLYCLWKSRIIVMEIYTG